MPLIAKKAWSTSCEYPQSFLSLRTTLTLNIAAGRKSFANFLKKMMMRRTTAGSRLIIAVH
jgi:hypothetical protein